MRKKWILKDIADRHWAEGLSDIIRTVLAGRGVVDEEDIQEFLSPKPKRTYDPFLMKDMDKAVDAILEAIAGDTRICVYGDYDSDGVTAICLLMEFLGKLTQNLTYYVPSRFVEGYGLNKDAIDIIKRDGVGLIITVDCGSTSYEEVEYAKASGIGIIVTDHHNINDRPAQCILVNPKQQECLYPFKDLCGCGVAFKLAQAIQRRTGIDRSHLTGLLDLVAIATIGDIVPLTGENRTMVKYGMEIINQGAREGIAVLAAAAGLAKQPIRSYQIAFVIVPHLNAAGRMAEAEAGVRLLTARDKRSIRDAAATLVANNTERKRIQEEDFRKCIEIVRRNHESDLFIIIDAENVHEGIAGIVAGKIKDVYCRPVIVVTASNGDVFLKGTGRSVEGLNIYDMLKSNSELFIKFGGHAGACGFLMDQANLPELRKNLNKALQELYDGNQELFIDRLTIDAAISPGDIDMELVRRLEGLEPYGHKNERPLFMLEKVRLNNVTTMGEDRQHARFSAEDLSGSVDCILFNEAAEYSAELEKGNTVSLAGYPDINNWNGTTKIQFVVRDIKCYINKVD